MFFLSTRFPELYCTQPICKASDERNTFLLVLFCFLCVLCLLCGTQNRFDIACVQVQLCNLVGRTGLKTAKFGLRKGHNFSRTACRLKMVWQEIALVFLLHVIHICLEPKFVRFEKSVLVSFGIHNDGLFLEGYIAKQNTRTIVLLFGHSATWKRSKTNLYIIEAKGIYKRK